jgi:large subunit ribosomal protein L23
MENKFLDDIIIAPVITERAAEGFAGKKYTFKVAKDANKIEIGKAVEALFGVKVEKVRTMNVRGRERRRGRVVGTTASWKKAIVSLKSDSKDIEFFQNLS